VKTKFSDVEIQQRTMRSYTKHWLIAPYHAEQSQGGYMHSYVKVSTEQCLFTQPFSGHKWAVHERQMLYCEGIIRTNKGFWVYSAPNFTTWLKNVQNHCQVGATLCKWNAVLVMPQHMAYQSGTISSWRRHIASEAGNCYWQNMKKGLWTGIQQTPPNDVIHIHHKNTII
jgi:hypothetical protein